MKTENCPCYDEKGNPLGWYSRSLAVVIMPFCLGNDGEKYVLASKRGKGTPDPEFVGCWNVTCGYLDWNETLKGACVRELFEETGVKVDFEDDIKLLYINDNPHKDKRQNVTVNYYIRLLHDKEYYEKEFSHKHNEKDEVGEIKFIPLKDVDKYEWAFNHDILIKRCVELKGNKIFASN